ncbi:hypothetical protein [Aquisphaera insulae]|uniref:hypothetical protein n=1 Tax=Aquisphaera insulae TaxID=2712864 RepID=UPI0013ECE675|nr:hypothetical protein [Aquisphaera insulae]
MISSSVRRIVPGMSLLALAAALAAATGGCGDSNAVKSMTVYPVSGKVLLKDDRPLTSGQVVFVLPAKGLEFSSAIGGDGAFKMTSQFGDGIPDGEYLIRIDPSASGSAPAKKSAGKSVWNNPYPSKYADEASSGLKATIKAGENSLEPFHLLEGPAAAKSKTAKAGRSDDD